MICVKYCYKTYHVNQTNHANQNYHANHQLKIEPIEPIALLIIRVPSKNDWGYFKIEMISITSIDPSRFADAVVYINKPVHLKKLQEKE